jgi:Kef-type K+ transport system membrane component KefB
MAGGSFLAILRLAGFLFAVWTVGKFAKRIGVSTIVFEISMGLLLSPGLGGKLTNEISKGIFNHEIKSPGGKPEGLVPRAYGVCPEKELYDTLIDERGKCIRDEARLATIAMIEHDDSNRLYELVHHMEVKDHCNHDCCKDEYNAYKASRRLAGSSGSSSGSGYAGPTFDSFVTCMEKECNDHMSHECVVEPDILTLIGHAGVSMMIFESGMHFDFEKARHVGPPACAVAVLGTMLPIIAGMLLIWLFAMFDGKDYPFIHQYGIAAGVSLAPTSVGIALKLLLEAKQLQKDFGQAIITAAFVDDILSLIAYNILFQATQGKFTFMSAIFPSIIGCILMVFGASLGVILWPKFVHYMMKAVPPKAAIASLSRGDEALLLLIFGLLIGYGTVTFFLGTHLWGCFVAGMSFAMIPHAHHVYVRQVKRLTCWMLRIFFACTVAFAIPYAELGSFNALWKGSIMGVFACIGTKVCCAFFMGRARFVIGWAMVGRAEFAYLIAAQAQAANIMDDETFAIIIWALLYATIFAPFCFRKVLASYAKYLANLEEEEAGAAAAKPSKGIRQNTLSTDAQKKQKDESLVGRAEKMIGSLLFAAPDESRGRSDTVESGEGKTQINGFRWHADKELTGYRFHIVHKKEDFSSCSVVDLQTITDILEPMQIIVTKLGQSVDHDTHSSYFQIEASEDDKLDEGALQYLQNSIARGAKGHVVFMPQVHALHSKSKLAKVTCIATLPETQAGAAGEISKIVNAVSNGGLFLMRAGLEIHGNTALCQFLVASAAANAKSSTYADVSRSAERTNLNQEREQALLTRQRSGEKWEAKDGSNIELSAEHLYVGSSDFPDIESEQLLELKKRVTDASTGWCQTVIEKLTYSLGPNGDVSHDWRTLMEGQDKSATFEIRFNLSKTPKNLLSQALRVLCKFQYNLLSASTDDRSASKINLVVTRPLAATKEDALLDALVQACDSCGIQTGQLDMADVHAPLEKKVRVMGKHKIAI